jgi:hypothetical protein
MVPEGFGKLARTPYFGNDSIADEKRIRGTVAERLPQCLNKRVVATGGDAYFGPAGGSPRSFSFCLAVSLDGSFSSDFL